MIIHFIANIIAFIISTGIVIWVGLTLFRILIMHSKKKKGKKEVLKLLDDFEKKFKFFYKIVLMGFGMLANMFISIILAIGSKPIIYKINQPFVGEGYATFASYVVAICIFTLLPRWFVKEQQGEEDGS